MTVLDLEILRRTFRLRLFAKTQVTSDRLYRENLAVDALEVAEDSYTVRETLLVTQEVAVSTGLVEALGQMRFDVYVRRGQGTELLDCVSKEIVDAFKPQQSISSADGSVKLELYGTSRGSGATDERTLFFVPVLIRWRGHYFNDPS